MLKLDRWVFDLNYDPIGNDGIFHALFLGNKALEESCMFLLKDLIDRYHDVWICCEEDYLQRLFLLQAECEGFLAINGQKPTELGLQKFYGISDDMTMGYLSSMIWSLTMKNSNDDHVRIDFGKYIAGLDALIFVKKCQIWNQLLDANGNVKYEGMTIEGEPNGSGTLYYPNGKIYQEGVFGKKGLLCGTEYYSNGNKRFSGVYEYNAGYGPNYPKRGIYCSKDGNYQYEGEIVVRRSGLGWPTVTFPKDYGPVVQHNAPDLSFFDDHIEIVNGSDE